MATVGNTYLTLSDVAKRTDKDGTTADIIEMLAEFNPILEDAPAVECNNGTKHLTTVRTGLPDATWRRLYEGVQSSKSHTRQVEDATGNLVARSIIDAKLIDLASDPQQLRLTESAPFLETMAQTAARTLIYGNQGSEPAAFTGFAPRFNDLSAENGNQIVDAGGTGSDNTSIWMITWGDTTAHLIYPKGSRAGLQRTDLDLETVTDPNNGGRYEVYEEKFEHDIGLSVRDWRYISRVANIDVSDLVPNAATGADLNELMIQAYYRLRNRRTGSGNAGRLVMYCNTKVKEFLHRQALKANANTFIRLSEVEGREVMSFMGVPIREIDAITNTEERVT